MWGKYFLVWEIWELERGPAPRGVAVPQRRLQLGIFAWTRSPVVARVTGHKATASQKRREPTCEGDTWGTHFASLSNPYFASLSNPHFASLSNPVADKSALYSRGNLRRRILE
jgi:hypothetical protein